MGIRASFCRIPPGSSQHGLGYPPLYRAVARYDRLVTAITLAVWIGLGSLNAWLAYLCVMGAISGERALITITLAAVPSLGVLLVLPLFSPRAYELTARGIVVRRPLRSFVIPYGEVVRAKRLPWTWKRVRICASGGLYGFFGLFYFKGLGGVWMYVTDRKRTVLVETRGGALYALSPDDPDGFLSHLTAMIKRHSTNGREVAQAQ